jgi:hypothetical protein
MCETGCEPRLDEMFQDPMTQALMQSDGIDEQEVKNLLREARDRYAPQASGLRGD